MKPHEAPVGHDFGAEFLVKVYSALVPVEHGPFHATTAPFVGEDCQFPEQGSTDAAAAMGGLDVDVFEIEAGTTDEGGVVLKEDGGCDDLTVDFGNEGFCGRLFAKQGVAGGLLGGFDPFRDLFELGQFEQERVNGGNVVGGGGADHGES